MARFALALLLALVASPAWTQTDLERGRYLVLVGHCNNCHTAGYTESAGEVPQARWLMGNRVGWRSGVGTTYPTNLRLLVSEISEEAWVTLSKTMKTRPPMPWWSMRDMTEADLRLMYRFIRGLGAAGDPAPAFLPPDQMPPPPFVQLPMPPAR
jgi:mono/diheme cytochrome c family protein